MRPLLLLSIALPLAVSAQPVVAFPEPTAESATRLCTEHEGERVCRTVDADGEGEVVVTRGGTERARWAATAPGAASDVRAFRVHIGDGRDGLVVAVLDAVSNGLGVATWTLSVLPDDADAPAYSFVARDFGPEGGSFATWRGRPVIWATEWLDADDPSGRRGPGFYLVGRPFYLTAEGLAPAVGLPIRARRLLRPFRSEPGGPVGWLSSRAAETRRRDPFWGGRPGGVRGEVAAVGEADDGYPLVVRVGAEERTVRVDPWAGGAHAARLGDGATGRLYPIQYRPADLIGRAVRLGEGPDGTHVVWLD